MKIFGSYVYDRMVAVHEGKFYLFNRAYTNGMHQWDRHKWNHIEKTIEHYIAGDTHISECKTLNLLTAYDVEVIYERQSRNDSV